MAAHPRASRRGEASGAARQVDGGRRSVKWRWSGGRGAVAVLAALAVPGAALALQPAGADPGPAQSVIVEASSTGAATDAVAQAGGTVASSLDPAGGTLADLTATEQQAVAATGDTVVADAPMQPQDDSAPAAPTHAPSAVYPAVTDASSLVARGIDGTGVNVAVLDTGIDASLPDLAGRVVDGVDLSGEGNPYQDSYGHGTFVAGLIASSGVSSGGAHVGEAPGAGLVSVKVAGASGATDEATVIRGIDWVIKHRKRDGIAVLNISLGTAQVVPTGLDPLDRAVESAWHHGIVVVTSAGNSGPANGTITSPGDDPLAITAGAIDDGGATDPTGYSIPPYSSVGPTKVDGWFKPDLVAPGRSVVSLAVPGSTIYVANPSALVGATGFVGSGTSFAAAITSGAAALLLQADPSLRPDDVKGRLLASAAKGPVGDPFVDGHGLLDVAAAAANTSDLDQAPAERAEANASTAPTLGATWAASTWNPATWDGLAWNGVAWNGVAWNGVAWNGVAWNGVAWNGVAWNGVAWNGVAWNGVAWNGLAWNGVAWNGVAWNGLAWNGVAWNGVAWNGLAWNGVAWNGVAWNGLAWNGVAWNGVAWNGVAWNGLAWNGLAWNGAGWD